VVLLNHYGQKQTYRSIRQISKKQILQSVVPYRSFTAFLVESVFCSQTCLLSIIASFSCISILQGSVATQLTCGGIFNNHFIANCPLNASVKKFWKSVNIWRRYEQSQSGTFFGTQCSCLYLLQTIKQNQNSDDDAAAYTNCVIKAHKYKTGWHVLCKTN